MKENDIQSNLTIGQFIAVHIKSEKHKNTVNIYIAETAEIDEADVGLRYMTHAGNKYTWPNKTKYPWQPIKDVLVVIPDPHLLNNSEQFMFENCSLQDGRLKALSMPGVKYTNFKYKFF